MPHASVTRGVAPGAPQAVAQRYVVDATTGELRPQGGLRGQLYYPLDFPDIPFELAKVEDDAKALTFVSRWGLLGRKHAVDSAKGGPASPNVFEDFLYLDREREPASEFDTPMPKVAEAETFAIEDLHWVRAHAAKVKVFLELADEIEAAKAANNSRTLNKWLNGHQAAGGLILGMQYQSLRYVFQKGRKRDGSIVGAIQLEFEILALINRELESVTVGIESPWNKPSLRPRITTPLEAAYYFVAMAFLGSIEVGLCAAGDCRRPFRVRDARMEYCPHPVDPYETRPRASLKSQCRHRAEMQKKQAKR